MAGIINQGTLNRALVSVSPINLSALTVTTGFFGSKLARLSFEGDASDYLATLTGGVPSGRLFQMVGLTFYLNKSQALAAQWEQQRLTNTAIGDVNVITDSSVMTQYYLQNCVLQNISELDLTGESNDFPVALRGAYPINSSLFQ
jgi:hypothetical protein